MSLSEMDQLYQAKRLAMENSPDQMLPKVLETAASLYLSKATSPALKLELGRFLSRLLLDVITHRHVSSSQKPFIASQHLDCLWSICRNVKDTIAYKYAILAFSASYALLFDLVAKTSNQGMWETMQQMKQFIVSNWNSAYPLHPDENDIFSDDIKSIGPRLATAKFISEIVIVHTSRNSNSSNKIGSISISSVPVNHPVISNKQQIESEGKKFLDILLNYLIEEPMMVSSLFIGVLNCLTFIMKQRPQATMRILVALLKFNVDAKYQTDDTSTLNYRLSKRFVERCYKNFVQFGLKSQLIKNSGQMASQHTKLSKISQTLHIIGEETKSKGILNFDATQIENKMSNKDKQKYLALRRKNQISKSGTKDVSPSPMTGSVSVPPLQDIAGSQNSLDSQMATNSRAFVESSKVDKSIQLLMDLQKYTMSKNNISNFFNNSPIAIDSSYCAIYSLMNSKNSEQDVSKLPQDVMIKLCSEAFYKTETTKMISGLSIVASRYTDLMNKAKQQAGSKKRKIDGSGDHLDQDIVKKPKNEENVKSQNEDAGDEEEDDDEDNYEYGAITEERKIDVELPKPKPMTSEDKIKHLQRIVENIMHIKDSDETPGITGTMGKKLDPLEKVKLLQWNNNYSWLHILTRLATRGVMHNEEMSNLIRQTLYDYFLEDFTGRIGMVLEWLGEEWFYESLSSANGNEKEANIYMNYDKWSLKFLEGLIPFLENKHRRLFIRLMSELPRIEQDHIEKVRPICLDPARSSLGFQTLKFLVMFRPPVKPKVKILLQQIKEEDSTAAEQCNAILSKFYEV